MKIRKLAKSFMKHIDIVHHIPEMFNRLTDSRKRRSISLKNVLLQALIGFCLQMKSADEIFDYECSRELFSGLLEGRLPKIDAARDALTLVDAGELAGINRKIVSDFVESGGPARNAIGGLVSIAIDGVELFETDKKKLPGALTRAHRGSDVESNFYRSVVATTVGGDPHLVLGQYFLKPRDGSDKDEGEQTGAKILVDDMWESGLLGSVDVVVLDGLYPNAPFINHLSTRGVDAVIRLKNENLRIVREAAEAFAAGKGVNSSFKRGKATVAVNEISLKMEGCDRPLRIMRFVEVKRGRVSEPMWVATTLTDVPPETVCEIMHRRWDEEENAFHDLSTYYNFERCFVGKATEVVLLLMFIAFNLRELFMFTVPDVFERGRTTRREFTIRLRERLRAYRGRKIPFTGFPRRRPARAGG